MYRERKASLRATITFKMTQIDTNVDKKKLCFSPNNHNERT
jgi:hypothetical protein